MVWPKFFQWRRIQLQLCALHSNSAKQACREEGELVGETNVKSLKTYGHDLVGLKPDRVFGRDNEVREVIGILSQIKKKNPLLIGEPGVGKIDVVKGLAHMISRGDVPSNIKNVKVIALDMVEFEGKLKAVLKDVQEARGKVILFIDNIHLVFDSGQTQWSTDTAVLLNHMISTCQLWCIGGTTPEGHKKYLVGDAVFEKNFQPVLVDELSVPATMNSLRELKESFERRHGVRILDSALVLAVQLSSRYITAQCLPDKAINLVNIACVNVKAQLDSQLEAKDGLKRNLTQVEIELQSCNQQKDKASGHCLVEVKKKLHDLKDKFLKKNEKENKIARVTDLKSATAAVAIKGGVSTGENVITVKPYEIAEVVSQWTGICVTKLLRTNDDKERLLGLADRLNQRVVGQDEAIKDVVDVVMRYRAGFGRLDRKIPTLLFVGPDFVAKRELAEALAEDLFYDKRFLIRINMTGYQGDGVDLAGVVKSNIFRIVLFDGVDKTHEAMFHTMFRMLDDGWLNDPNPDTVLILNYNFEPCFFGKVASKVTHPFKSELIDSLDDVVVFNADQ